MEFCEKPLGRIRDAEKVFDGMETRDTISWNSMISLYSHENLCFEAFKLFSAMRVHRLKPDATTIWSLLSVCAGKRLHSLCTKNGLDNFASVKKTLMKMYSMAGELGNAEFLFDEMPGSHFLEGHYFFLCSAW